MTGGVGRWRRSMEMLAEERPGCPPLRGREGRIQPEGPHDLLVLGAYLSQDLVGNDAHIYNAF